MRASEKRRVREWWVEVNDPCRVLHLLTWQKLRQPKKHPQSKVCKGSSKEYKAAAYDGNQASKASKTQDFRSVGLIFFCLTYSDACFSSLRPRVRLA